MSDILVAIISMASAFGISYITLKGNEKKTAAQIAEIYARLGIDKEKYNSESANTWMEVARKATESYRAILEENISLRKENKRLKEKIELLEERIEKLEKKL
jgi:flagellar motility protein MotE (MotC chaperone)